VGDLVVVDRHGALRYVGDKRGSVCRVCPKVCSWSPYCDMVLEETFSCIGMLIHALRRLGQIAVDEGYGHCAFADSGGDAVHRAVPHVTRGERSRHAGLEVVRQAFQLPAFRRSALIEQIRTRDEISGPVTDDFGILRPFGVRFSSDAHKDLAGIDPFYVSCLPVGDLNPAQYVFSLDLRHFRLIANFHGWIGKDAVYEVAGE
jgi:hypothetical protein